MTRRYVPSGHLVYARSGTLVAQPFDVAALEVSGKPTSLVDDVMHDVNSRFAVGNSGAAQFSIAGGTLAYLRGGIAPEGDYSPVWVDRSGTVEEIEVPRRIAGVAPAALAGWASGRVPVSGRHRSLRHRARNIPGDVGGSDALTSGAHRVWPLSVRRMASRRTNRVAFTGERGNLFSVVADGSGVVEPLTTSDAESISLRRVDTPSSWSPDGKTLAFTRRQDPQTPTNRDIWMLSVGNGPPTARPFLTTPADERVAEFSHDGRYVAYRVDAVRPGRDLRAALPGNWRASGVDRRRNPAGVGPRWTRAVLLRRRAVMARSE